MRSITKAVILLAVLMTVGFVAVNETIPEVVTAAEAETVLADEIVTENVSEISYIKEETYKASWYGPGFHGRLTANGETYDQEAMTAAHKSLPFNTLLKVTNPKNEKSIVIRINDRGPYIHGRDLDLSKAAARELGMLYGGVADLKVEFVSLTGADAPVVSIN